MNKFRAATAATLLWPFLALGQTAGKTPVLEDFIRTDRFHTVKISPKGTYIAATVPVDDKTVLVVLKPGETKPMAHFNLRGKTHVMDFAWANDNRLLFTLGEKDGALEQPSPQWEIWGMDADGSQTKVLVGWQNSDRTSGRAGGKAVLEPVAAMLVDALEHDDDKAIIAVYRAGTPFTTAERMDVKSGSRIPVAQAPIERATFLTDRSGEVRFALGAKSDNFSRLYYRKSAKSDWTVLNDEAVSGRAIAPLGFSADNATVYLQANEKSGPDSVLAFDVATEQSRTVVRDDFVDPAGLVYAVGKSHPIGVQFNDPRPRFHYFEPESADAKLHRALQASFDGDTVVAGPTTTAGGEVLLFTYSDRNPGDYFAFDLNKRSARHIISRRDWINPLSLGETRAFEFTARDGRKLQGFVTLPPGSSGKGLPMVVNPHGGPFGLADGWSFGGERHLLASHGYAVLQVNFRGSGGYGREHQVSGYRQWGQAMQDDVTDATRWAIQEGIADAGRVCIYGASYGGYAALMGVAKEPALYRCAVGYIGVYDLPMLHTRGDADDTLAGQNELLERVGKDNLEATSPARLGSRIKVPVFLAAGGEDKRAPKEHTQAMERAIRDAGGSVESLYYPTEGHGFYKIEHNREFYGRVLSFLARHIGGTQVAGGATPATTGK